ncbi:hypothetical protein ACLESO_48625 [Pyxidicoccus sp. 3LG]
MAKEDLTLLTGRDVSIRSLDQSRTYEGLLEGLPTRQMNQRILQRLVEEARSKVHGVEPYLVPPREKPIDYSRDGRPYPFGDPAMLPSVVCIARLHSRKPARNRDCDYSALAVVWLQEEFAFPIDPGVMDYLRALDWDNLAADDQY